MILFYELTINKPLHGNYVGVWDKRLKEAIKKKQMIKITMNGIGTGFIEPKQFMMTGQRTKRAYYKPNEPMVFYQNYVKILTPEQIEEEESREWSKLNH